MGISAGKATLRGCEAGALLPRGHWLSWGQPSRVGTAMPVPQLCDDLRGKVSDLTLSQRPCPARGRAGNWSPRTGLDPSLSAQLSKSAWSGDEGAVGPPKCTVSTWPDVCPRPDPLLPRLLAANGSPSGAVSWLRGAWPGAEDLGN